MNVTERDENLLEGGHVLLRKMSLKLIDRESIHQICSGQVILNLATAAKELVENSIDARATNIEVRLKEFGADLLEVSDNGSGVEPGNYQNLTLKHYTSKIRDFSDIVAIDTFGFRGEALSSLCALGDLVITTCSKGQSVASCIEYDHSGMIKGQSKCARERGTTVSLSNLFGTLPVRQKEFRRNLKKEYGRLIHMLQAYCVIVEGIKITCYNQTGKIKRQLVLSNSPRGQIIDNVSCVFGPSQTETIVPITQCSGEEVISALSEREISADVYNRFQLSGYISKCTHGCGRSTTDRQFMYFNGRPCDHSKLSKTINEVYHMFNQNQYPFVIINVKTIKESIDVNVTPDKRQIMVQQEKVLLDLVKESLIKLYTPMQGQLGTCHPSSQSSNKKVSNGASHKRPLSQSIISSDEPKQKQLCLMNFGSTRSKATKSTSPSPKSSTATNSTKPSLTNQQKEGEKIVSCDSGIETDSAQEKQIAESTTSLSVEHIVYDTDRRVCKEDAPGSKMTCNIEDITARACYMGKRNLVSSHTRKQSFHAKIQPSCNRDAEEELKRELSKEHFKEMEVLGQFNLGFIITRLDHNLFIIDQHATDEKYNYERLKKETVIEHQTLLQPLSLELTAVGESVIKDNLEIFEKNGFRFDIEENAPPTKRIKLIGKPVSKNWTMGTPEIDELIFLLTDSPGEMVRPTCVTKMLASRSCRSSVMIGTALNNKEMTKLVVHMSEMDQPWNCPHGRPTIRHLVDLSRINN